MIARRPFDLAAHVRRSREGGCFICAFLGGDPEARHHRIAEDADMVAFLSKYPTLPGYTLVCPKRHVVDLADDLSPEQYGALQGHVHRVARALKRVFDAERIYVLSLGSVSGNAHLHWHVVPLPKGVPYERQQYHALMAENGILAFTEAEMAEMARRIAQAYAALD